MSPVYCFKCNDCNNKTEWPSVNPPLCRCGSELVRDYKAESVALNRENIRAVEK